MYRSLGNLGQLLSGISWPVDFFSPDNLPAFLDDIYVIDYRMRTTNEGFFAQVWVAFSGEVSLGLPGFDGVKIVAGGGDVAGLTFIDFILSVGSESYLSIRDAQLALRFDPSILKPAALSEGDVVPPFTEIRIEGSITVNQDFDITVEGFDALTLTPCMIGSSGVIIAADDVMLDVSRTDSPPEILNAGFDETFIGVYIGVAQVKLPEGLPQLVPQDLVLGNAAIGSGGVSGLLEAHYSPTPDLASKTFDGNGAGDLFGIPFGLEDIILRFKQNSLIESKIAGKLILPFFDELVDVEIGIDVGGGFTVKLAGSNGLYKLKKPGVLEVELDSLGFEVKNGVFTAKLSGKLKPLFGDMDWPDFDLKQLTIDSLGNVKLDGGWLPLPKQYKVDFYGFQFEITKMGLGKTKDGGKWIGFSGGLKLIDGLEAGASVEGLRFTWYEDGRKPSTSISFNGIGVEFEVPDVLRFKGAISYRELQLEKGEIVHRFDGDIKLQLLVLDMVVDAKLVIGSASGLQGPPYTFFAIYIGAELPAGIPLWSTGLALYGLSGLFAIQMEPDKKSDEPWYGMGPGEGWYKRPEVGVTDLKSKWVNRRDSLALGGGITIGTVADNGFTLSSRMLLVIVFPGPIILLEGRANILKERSSLSSGEPAFQALAVLDGRAGSFLVGLDAKYRFGDKGELIDIGGSAEAYFSLSDADAWHLYVGQRDPMEKRIHAQMLSLFQASGYFMIDAKQLAMGARIGYGKSWEFGPVALTAEAWIEGNTIISWNPAHLYGDLWLHGKLALRVCGFGFGISLDARFAAGVFDPFYICAEFQIVLDLPWPIPGVDVSIKLEWGPEPKIAPLLPKPLKEVSIEHFKVTTSWPLRRGELLLPVYDLIHPGMIDGSKFLLPDLDPNVLPAKENLVVVPLDARPHITFGRPVHDDALVGNNPKPPDPDYERIGNPDTGEGPVKVRYSLNEVTLQRLDGSNLHTGTNWDDVASKKQGTSSGTMYGTWAPIPALPLPPEPEDSARVGVSPVAQVKLWLWSKTPFDYTRFTGRAWDEWFTERFKDYLCISDAPDRHICSDFEDIDRGNLKGPFIHGEFIFDDEAGYQVIELNQPVNGKTRALCASQNNTISIEMKTPARAIEITVVPTGIPDSSGEGPRAEALDVQERELGSFYAKNNVILVEGVDIDSVKVIGYCIVQVCADVGPDPRETATREEISGHLTANLTAHFIESGYLLEPHSIYRLKVVTKVDAKAIEGLPSPYVEGVFQKELTEYAYFRTEGPPGLSTLSNAEGSVETSNPPEEPTINNGLQDLALYVRQTIPPTVPAEGKKPQLPPPAYRAYDVGVEFNEDYVDLLYRIAHRDLGLYLYDNNNRPVRDSEGRLISLSNRWGKTDTLTLEGSEKRLLALMVNTDCIRKEEPDDIQTDSTLTSLDSRQVLDPDTLYEARLVPLLLHEDFITYDLDETQMESSELLGGWHVIDSGTNNSQSHWQVGGIDDPLRHYIEQVSNIWGGELDARNAYKPGTLLICTSNPTLPDADKDQPTNWTDYRISVYVRSAMNGAIGVVFRYTDDGNYYLFTMDREGRYRRLVRVENNRWFILAEDDFIYQSDQDYLISVEAIGSDLYIYQDGTLIFHIQDNTHQSGKVGLYCWHNEGARFTDVRIDDFGVDARVVYRFEFITSKYAHFLHHLHSFQDETWQSKISAGQVPDVLLAKLITKAATSAEALSSRRSRRVQSVSKIHSWRCCKSKSV